jgi:hypothetical protein
MTKNDPFSKNMMIKNSMIQKKSIDQKNDAWSNRQKVDFLALKMKNLPFEKIYNIKNFIKSKNLCIKKISLNQKKVMNRNSIESIFYHQKVDPLIKKSDKKLTQKMKILSLKSCRHDDVKKWSKIVSKKCQKMVKKWCQKCVKKVSILGCPKSVKSAKKCQKVHFSEIVKKLVLQNGGVS